MSIRWKHLAAVITSVCLAVHCAAQQVPVTHAKALDDSVVSFPQSGSAKPLLLVLGFSHKSEKQCDNWNDRLRPSFMKDARVSYYEMADFQGVPSFVMRMILHGIRKKIPNDEHGHFVPLYSDEAEWKKLVGYSAPDGAYVVLADATGHVLWQAHGEPTDAEFSNLKAEIAKLIG
jgi:hypothetical protein